MIEHRDEVVPALFGQNDAGAIGQQVACRIGGVAQHEGADGHAACRGGFVQDAPLFLAEAEVEAVVLLIGGPSLFGRLHGSLVFGATSVDETCFRRRSGCYARPLTPGLSLRWGTEWRSQ